MIYHDHDFFDLTSAEELAQLSQYDKDQILRDIVGQLGDAYTALPLINVASLENLDVVRARCTEIINLINGYQLLQAYQITPPKPIEYGRRVTLTEDLDGRRDDQV